MTPAFWRPDIPRLSLASGIFEFAFTPHRRPAFKAISGPSRQVCDLSARCVQAAGFWSGGLKIWGGTARESLDLVFTLPIILIHD